jgi:hypothetical protein
MTKEVICDACGNKGRVEFHEDKVWTIVVCGCGNHWDEYSERYHAIQSGLMIANAQ